MPNNNSGGRPSTHGVKQGWMLLRATIAIEAFNRVRQLGEKYEASLDAAVAAVKTEFPTMKISPSTVKKILKEFMPENGEQYLKVTIQETVDPNADPTSPAIKTYGAGFAERPEYPLPAHRKPKKPME